MDDVKIRLEFEAEDDLPLNVEVNDLRRLDCIRSITWYPGHETAKVFLSRDVRDKGERGYLYPKPLLSALARLEARVEVRGGMFEVTPYDE